MKCQFSQYFPHSQKNIAREMSCSLLYIAVNIFHSLGSFCSHNWTVPLASHLLVNRNPTQTDQGLLLTRTSHWDTNLARSEPHDTIVVMLRPALGPKRKTADTRGRPSKAVVTKDDSF